MGNYIKKASIHPIDPIDPVDQDQKDPEPVTIGSLSLKEQIENMELDIKPESVPSPIKKSTIKHFTFEETYTSLYQMPHTPTNSPAPSHSSDSESDSEESPVLPVLPELPEPTVLPVPLDPVPLEPNPSINDIIGSRFWKVKEDFKETHKIIYDMMKELML